MATPPDDIVSMAVFAHVIAAGSFTGAARALGLSRSAVSERVMRLERRLGVHLLHRTTRRLALTSAGELLRKPCTDLIANADLATEAATQGGRVQGLLRVAAPVAFGQRYLASTISRFLQRHPDVRFDLQLSDRVADPTQHGFDVSLRFAMQLADSNLVARRLGEDRRVVCGAPAYFARAGVPRRPADLARHNCLHFSPMQMRDEWRFLRGRTPVDVTTRGSVASDDATLLLAAARAGIGLVVLPSFLVHDDISRGELREVLRGYENRRITLYAVHAHGRNVPARVRLLVEHLAQEYRAPPWL
jgi:DNA-binding transcriptional LysR family regulator